MSADPEAFAVAAHGKVRYGGQPYRVHLAAVVQVLSDFGVTDPDLIAAGWLHDTLEDTKTSWNDLAANFGVRVADLVLAVSGFGETRKERNRLIYANIAKMPEAAIIKLADRIANVEFSDPSSGWFRMYFNERNSFGRAVYPYVGRPQWKRLDLAYEKAVLDDRGRIVVEPSIPSTSLGDRGT